MNNKEFFQKYKDILKNQANDGLEILKKLKVDDDNYQKIVVNINNANNIATLFFNFMAFPPFYT